jgi:raffinose/stachyose/melibiose transport system permease protein
MGLFRYTRRSLAREILVVVVVLGFCIPAYALVTLSLKSPAQVYTEPLKVPTHPDFGNYSAAWHQAGQGGLGKAMVGSGIITGASVLGLIIFGSLFAYALARRPSKLSGVIYSLVVLGIILPFQLAIIPIYVALRHLHLTGTYLGMVILYIGLLMPFTVFLYTGFIRALPKEYEEAAQVDGAGLLRIYLRVVFPLLLPVTGTVAILAGVFIWNDFFTPLVFLSGTGKTTLPLAVYSFVGEYASQWNLVMAAIAISLAPILALYLLAQRQLIRGFSGGIRG